MSQDDLSSFSMDDLFRAEAEAQCESLSNDLLALESVGDPSALLESLMRAAHSLKGAARIIGRDDAVRVAHVMEETFVAAQKTSTPPSPAVIDVLLTGVDLLRQLAGVTSGIPEEATIASFIKDCANPPSPADSGQRRRESDAAPKDFAPARESGSRDRRDLRMDAEQLDNLLALAGQAMVAVQAGGREFMPVRAALRQLQAVLGEMTHTDDEGRRLALLRRATAASAHCQSIFAEESERRDLEQRRLAQICSRMYRDTLACRLRPFGDIIPGIRRLVRDLARDLGKEVRVDVSGDATEVDRDLLDRLDGPLAHLVRNALDHGIESPDARTLAGKSAEGILKISARHQGGWLIVSVSDDGKGLDGDEIKAAILRRGLAAREHIEQMTETELTEFLLLPGFSLSERVTEISGRGVGLDAVRAMAYGAGGSLRVTGKKGSGFLCEITLPVSLSLMRALIVDIAGEFCALPLTRVERVLHVSQDQVHAVGGRQHIFLAEERVEILSAAQVLELGDAPVPEGDMSAVIVQGAQGKIGLVVDRFLGMRELSLQRLDPRLGRVQDVSATALLDTGEPVVVLDINDLAISALHFSSGARYRPVTSDAAGGRSTLRRVLVADDSLTVRELERKLLAGRGYAVEAAVDGADAWNTLRGGHYDLLVTDIDMPRLDGIELVRLVRADARLRDLPVIIVSYKDRPEDRARGLEAGADYYLAKSGFQDESLLKAVHELIGNPSVVV